MVRNLTCLNCIALLIVIVELKNVNWRAWSSYKQWNALLPLPSHYLHVSQAINYLRIQMESSLAQSRVSAERYHRLSNSHILMINLCSLSLSLPLLAREDHDDDADAYSFHLSDLIEWERRASSLVSFDDSFLSDDRHQNRRIKQRNQHSHRRAGRYFICKWVPRRVLVSWIETASGITVWNDSLLSLLLKAIFPRAIDMLGHLRILSYLS